MATKLVSANVLTARYYEGEGYLELHAEGEKGWVGEPYFEPIFNLRFPEFALQANSLGIGPELKEPLKPTPYTADLKYPCSLHPGGFDTDVSIETADGFKAVKIEYIGIPVAHGLKNDPKASYVIPERVYKTEIRPAIKLYWTNLLGGTISADVPPKQVQTESTVDEKSSLVINFNPEVFVQTRSKIENGKIEWQFLWTNGPFDPQRPQPIDVVYTTVVLHADKYITTRVIQPYLVHYVVLPDSA